VKAADKQKKWKSFLRKFLLFSIKVSGSIELKSFQWKQLENQLLLSKTN